MGTLFYILLFLAIWHFFYEGIIAPSLRHGLRYEFFSLRDELRNLHISGLSTSDKKVYSQLDIAICDIINSMAFINLGNYYLLKKNFAVNEKIKKEVDRRRLSVQNAENKKLVEIDYKVGHLGAKALFINNGSWLLFLFAPIAVLLFVYLLFRQLDGISKSFIKMSSRLIYSHDKVGNGLGLA